MTRNDSPWGTREWKNATLFLLTLGAVLLCWRMMLPFLSALVGAVVLAVATQRPHDWLRRKLKRPALAATIALVGVLLSIITPCFFLVGALAEQSLVAVDLIRDGTLQAKFFDLIDKNQAVATALTQWAGMVNFHQVGQSGAAYAAAQLAKFLGSSIGAITQIVVMLFVLFFLYRDSEAAVDALRQILPLREGETDTLLTRMNDTIYATVLGRLTVVAVQGFLAGVAYWALGVPVPLLWAMMTALAALIPVFGAVLVWLPIAIYLGMMGFWLKAAMLGIWCALVVSTIDNFLYPILVGSRLRQHTAAVLISILGGISLFGLPGIILGPLVLTIAETLLSIWRARLADAA